MNAVPFTANAAGPWTPVRQGEREFVPALGQRVLCLVGQRMMVAKLELQGSERVWRWTATGHVAFEDVDAWAEIKVGPRCVRPGETDEAARNAALPNPS